jgi:predicted Fe-S protein YdhL (DUF1289 family)
MHQRCYRCKLPTIAECSGCGRPCCPLDSEIVDWYELSLKRHTSFLCLLLTKIRHRLRQKLRRLHKKEHLTQPARLTSVGTTPYNYKAPANHTEVNLNAKA